MVDLLLIILLLAVGFYWSNAMKARETAFVAAKVHCQKMGLQLLDEYVALTGIWAKRDRSGSLKAWRSYQFEFSSTGDERYQGKLVMLGQKIITIHLDPYRMDD